MAEEQHQVGNLEQNEEPNWPSEELATAAEYETFVNRLRETIVCRGIALLQNRLQSLTLQSEVSDFRLLPVRNRNNVNPITAEEIRGRIEELPIDSGKGIDEVTAELLKNGGDTLVRRLVNLFNNVLTGNVVPEQWNVVPMSPQYNQLRSVHLGNISLLKRVYTSILARRLSKKLENFTNITKWHFKDDADSIKVYEQKKIEASFLITQLIEKFNKLDKPIYFLKVKFDDPFETVYPYYVLKCLQKFEAPNYLINAFRSLLLNLRARNDIEEEIDLKRGLHMGEDASNVLLSIVLQDVFDGCDDILREFDSAGVVKIDQQPIRRICFNNEFVLVGTSVKYLKRQLGILATEFKQYGLTIDDDSLELLKNRCLGPYANSFIFNRKTVKIQEKMELRNFEFLDRLIQSDESIQEEIQNRIECAQRKYQEKRADLSNMDQINRNRLFKTSIIPVLTFGSETWQNLDTHSEDYNDLQNELNELVRMSGIENFQFNLENYLYFKKAEFVGLHPSNGPSDCSLILKSEHLKGTSLWAAPLIVKFQEYQTQNRGINGNVTFETILNTVIHNETVWGGFVNSLRNASMI